jgi:protein ImuA
MQAGAASEHAAVATLFVAGILARNKGPVLWCLLRRDLFAPALAGAGLHPARVRRVVFARLRWRSTHEFRDGTPALGSGP